MFHPLSQIELMMAFLAPFGLTAIFGIFGLYTLQKFKARSKSDASTMMVFGLVTALAQSLRRIAGPLLGGIAFDINIGYPNYMGALIMVIGFLIRLLLLQQKA